MSSTLFAFFCTDQAGWESDDYRMVFLSLAGLVALLALNKLWLIPHSKNSTVNMLRKVVVSAGTLVLILITAFFIWLAPC
jgi:hypothetical protein